MNWPILLKEGEITLQPLRLRDRRAWLDLRNRNREWLKPWEATSPLIEEQKTLPTYVEMVNFHKREGKAGRSYSFAIWFHNQLIGQITLGGVSYGAYRGAHIGYWIDKDMRIRGLRPEPCAR